MFRSLFILIPGLVFGAGTWSEFRTGPFEVLTERNEDEARETLNYLEQLRHATGSLLGVADLVSVWPVRVIVLEGKRTQTYPALKLARDAWVCSITEIKPETAASVVKVLLDSWTGQIPPNLERGLISLLSTLQVSGTHVTLGHVPAQKDRDWSRAHVLAVHPDYSGKVRVLLSNLGRGVDSDVAYRNAFQRSAQDIERDLDRYIQVGNYGTVPVSGKPVNARRDFLPKQLDAIVGQLALADLLLANDAPGATTTYDAILKREPENVEAREGLGLLAVSAGRIDQAQTWLKTSKSPRPLLEFAKLSKDPEQKKTLLMAAAKANPRWAEPHRLLASVELHPAQRLAALRSAAQLEPRDAATWIALAEAQETNGQLAEAAKSWSAAERATDDPSARERIRQARLASEQRRAEQQIAARDEARRKAEQELQDLRNRALMEIRKAEAKANEGKPVIDARTLDQYREGPELKKLSGSLQRVDCLGDKARLHVLSGRQVVRILVPDPSKIEIAGGGERSLACGVQKPPRNVTLTYRPENDGKLDIAGEAATIEFR